MANVWPNTLWTDVTSIIAVSGGSDSVALLRLLADQDVGDRDGQFVVAHFNHGWRGAESDEDARFVESLSQQLNIRCEVGSAEGPAAASEADARNDRYEFLLNLAHQLGARFVVTAHTADDQVETVLHRIIRGTGISGLRGIPKMRSLSESVTVVRPLIDVTRNELTDFLNSIDQSFRNDSSNQDCKFTRNRIRQELLPELRREYNAEVNSAILRLSRLAGEHQQEIESTVELIFANHVTSGRNEHFAVPRKALGSLTSLVQRELFRSIWNSAGWPLQEMGFEQWHQLASLGTDPKSKSINLPGNIRAVADDEFIRLEPGECNEAS